MPATWPREPATEAPLHRGVPSAPLGVVGVQTTLPKSKRKPSKQGLALTLHEGRGSLSQEGAGEVPQQLGVQHIDRV